MKYRNILEEELKNRIASDFFRQFDCNRIIGKIDFCVAPKSDRTGKMADYDPSYLFHHRQSFFWAEAKKGQADIYKSLVQLILTIGKARTFDAHLPPLFLGAFDFERIAFIPYGDIHNIFYLNDFNWNVTSSNHNSKEFKLILETVEKTLEQKSLLFNLAKDSEELLTFIKENFVQGVHETHKVKIDKNNFMVVYNKWLQEVKPSIALVWTAAQRQGIIDGDFYLADLLSQDNKTLKEKLFVVLETNIYKLDKHVDSLGLSSSKEAQFNDGQKAHTQFWNRYERPPKEEYWDYIINRRDLLVPQDIRERKGSFFTPQIWVEKSQEYIADVLGKDWQDEYHVWDCAAGTGNLLTGLTNKYNIWASTLDKQDVDVMHDRIKNGANLLESHCFQFDFLNDNFSTLPEGLQNIINDEEKRKKLVMYINPPYAEAGNRKQLVGTGRNKPSTTTVNIIYNRYKEQLGKASNELFTQFLMRINKEITGCRIANFSKLKILQSPNFNVFTDNFKPELIKLFLVPAKTFDNVKGNFPIGFMIWNTAVSKDFIKIQADCFDRDAQWSIKKMIYNYNGKKKINTWLQNSSKNLADRKILIGSVHSNSNDFQHQNDVFIDNSTDKKTFGGLHTYICEIQLIQTSILFAVRHCIKATWLNDRDQFLYPQKSWQTDTEFQNNGLAYALFHGQNRISGKEGINHWIPFTETEVDAKEKFTSNFMHTFISGKIQIEKNEGEISVDEKSCAFIPQKPLEFSTEAQAVFDAGRELWRYYHTCEAVNVNASFYDIREHFQGRNDAGKMNSKSPDTTYNNLLGILKIQMEVLRKQIVPKVYEHGFLLK
ncbi:hypothetical protein P0082_09310 [Candidatus Haliotispira prima]|uniref:Uncharacterized protein n=1 Tax=Candidatus Haliotispira prima TaxID=3034016 RepID=A0ABY8MFI6_9SPIO|nr:hypothetical protein P0082_09310 [Candidatus Haliotispira prima]